MIKRDLLKLRPLKATPKMMRMAADDIPKKETYSCNGYTYTRETVQHDLFLRCAVQAGILKVSLFIPNIMRLGSIKPAFDVFIDRAAKKFLTFDYDKSRWPGNWIASTGKLFIIPQRINGFQKPMPKRYRNTLAPKRGPIGPFWTTNGAYGPKN